MKLTVIACDYCGAEIETPDAAWTATLSPVDTHRCGERPKALDLHASCTRLLLEDVRRQRQHAEALRAEGRDIVRRAAETHSG